MDKLLAAVFCFILINPQLGFAKVNPAQTPEELEAQITEPGNETGLSVMTNTVGLRQLQVGLEPYLPEEAKYGMQDEEEGLYIRQAEGPATGTDSETSTQDATER